MLILGRKQSIMKQEVLTGVPSRLKSYRPFIVGVINPFSLKYDIKMKP